MVWSNTGDNSAKFLTRYGSAIVTALGTKLMHLVQRITGVDPAYAQSLRKFMFDGKLTNEDKLEFLKLKVKFTLKNLTGSKRR